MRFDVLRLVLPLLFLVVAVRQGAAEEWKAASGYKIEPVSSPPIRIDAVRVWTNGRYAYVTGDVSRFAGYLIDPPDCIRVAIYDSAGKKLLVAQDRYFPKPVPLPSSRLGHRTSAFSIRLNFIPPPSSLIKVVYLRLD